MKPLTIEQLKALEVGDWVWIVYKNNKYSRYECLKENGKELFVALFEDTERWHSYSDYGTKWVAYKNKEQAEAKGDIVELPCLRDKPPIYLTDKTYKKRKELNYMTKDKTICSVVYWEDEFDEAERRLAELTKE